MTGYIIPSVVLGILLFSLRKTQVYKSFTDGVEKGAKTTLGIFPAILSIMVATRMLEASGAFDFLLKLLSPVTELFDIPKEIMPLAIVRPMSGGAALGIFENIIKEYGADSESGRIASMLMGSTETTFYALMVYFKNTRVKYTKKIIPAALIGDIVGLLGSVWVYKIIF